MNSDNEQKEAIKKDIQELERKIEDYPRPAGFWIRVGATLIDGLVFSPILVLALLNMFLIKSIFLMLLIWIPGLIYKPFMESFYGATLGKMVCGIRVIDGRGEKLSLSVAYIRFIPFILTSITGLVMSFIVFSSPDFQNASNVREIARLYQGNPLRLIDRIMYYIGLIECVVAAFTYRKRALHDMIAGSFCIRKQRGK